MKKTKMKKNLTLSRFSPYYLEKCNYFLTDHRQGGCWGRSTQNPGSGPG